MSFDITSLEPILVIIFELGIIHEQWSFMHVGYLAEFKIIISS